MADNVLQFSTFQREAKRQPLSLTLPDGEVIVVPIPDGDQMMKIEEAGQTRRALKIAFGEQWSKVEPLVKELADPDSLREFAMTVMQKLGVAPDDAPPVDGPR